MNSTATNDAFWSIARAVTAKGATQAQAAKVKDYLRKLIANYQGGTVCDSLTDAELNELLQLAEVRRSARKATNCRAARTLMGFGTVLLS